MRFGVIGDTHGNSRAMHEAADRLTRELGAAAIVHTGDDYSDAEELRFAGLAVYAVPGLWCPEYSSGRVEKWLHVHFDWLHVACAHADKDLRAKERAAHLVVTGHTHRARIESIGATVYLNPGHLKSKLDRGECPSFALCEVREDELAVAIHELSGALRVARRFPRALFGETERVR